MRENRETDTYGKKIISPDRLIKIELKGLKGKEEDGIFIQVSYTRGNNLADEIVISQLIQNKYAKQKYNAACMCVAPQDKNCKDTHLNFMVGILDDTRHVS